MVREGGERERGGKITRARAHMGPSVRGTAERWKRGGGTQFSRFDETRNNVQWPPKELVSSTNTIAAKNHPLSYGGRVETRKGSAREGEGRRGEWAGVVGPLDNGVRLYITPNFPSNDFFFYPENCSSLICL